MRPSRRELLAAGAGSALGAALAGGGRAVAEHAPSHPARNLVVVFASGGWDPTYSIDPKEPVPGIFDAPPEGTVRRFGAIDVLTDDATRPSVTTFFEKYGALSAVVRGVGVQSIVHEDCAKRVLTGTASENNPDVAAIAAYELGRDLPAPYLVLGTVAYTGPLAAIATRAGTANQITTLLEPETRGLPTPAELGTPFVLSDGERALVRAYNEARAQRALALRGSQGHNRARIDDYLRSIERSELLRGYARAFGEFDFTPELGVQIALVLSGLETGLCRAAEIDGGFLWDTHDNNSLQAGLHEELFRSLIALADGLASRKGALAGGTLLDETVVAVLSEMGRTPLYNATLGKDHHTVTSVLVFGAGVKGGRAYGGTGPGLEPLTVNFATGDVDPGAGSLLTSHLAAALLELVGVDAEKHLPNAEAFRAILA